MASASIPEFRLSSSQTAIALTVPAHFQAQINAIRKIHDKAYRNWEPHINILYPFVDVALLSSALAAIRAYLSSNPISPFVLKIGDVGNFEHARSATVFLKPGEESEEQICRLRSQLVAALGRSEEEGTRDGTFRPHLTMGQASLMGPTKDRLVQKVGKLVGFEWEVEGLVVLRREGTGEMSVVDEIRFYNDGGEGIVSNFAGTLWKPCYHFLPDTGWQQTLRSIDSLTYSQESTRTSQITIASYNLMSDPEAPRFSDRLPRIIEAISQSILRDESSIRVLCLQEVDEEMLPLLLSNSNLQALFPFSTHTSSSLLPSKRNLITLSNEAFSSYSFPFKERHKSALIVSFRQTSIQVANVHLTRGLTDEAVAAKKDQMKVLTDFLIESQNSIEAYTFVVGDFNLNSSSKTLTTALAQGLITPKTAQSNEGIIDVEVWNDAFLAGEAKNLELEAIEWFEGEQGATFDRLRNPLTSISKVVIDNRPQRYDRILFKKGAQMNSLNFEIFGQPSDEGTCPSDHYGICALFEIKAMRNTVTEIAIDLQPKGSIEIVEDSTDIELLIDPCLPTAGDRQLRKEAIDLLQETLSQHRSLANLILAPLGSYAMDTYFADSDVDVLAIASINPQLFFALATEQLRGLTSGTKHSFKGVHFVNSLVSIIEINILGIKFDIQYCQASELVKGYHSTTPPLPLENLIFDNALVSKLAPSSLRPLNTYRSTIYLLTTLPSFDSYRIAHRFLALYLQHHGLYSAKFGYLGGIHLSLLLNRVLKLAPRNKSSSLTPATMVRTFFEYYSTFNWAQDMVCDPEFKTQKGRRVERTARDAVVIQALHLPAARPNVAASCTRLSALIISAEFERAKKHLENGEWKACLSSQEVCVSEFLSYYGAFIAISIQVWDESDVDGEKIRDVVGAVESRIVRLLVELGRIEGLEGRAWPERFCPIDEVGKSNTEVWQCFYLFGIKSREQSEEMKKLASSKVRTAAKDFELCLRKVTNMEEEDVLISVDILSKKKLKGLGLVLNRRE